MKNISLLFLSLFLLGCAKNTDNIKNVPDNWRLPNQEDAVNDWARFNSPNKIIDDFDGDGKRDVAQILVSGNTKKGYSFVVEMGGKNSKQFILETSESIPAQSVAIEALSPSEKVWESACEKGYWDCKDDEIRQFKIIRPSIQFCYIESACSVFLWSEKNQNFLRIPISD